MKVDVRERVAVAMSVRGQLDDGGADMETTIGALAVADELGRVLWRIRYGEISRASGFDRAVSLLVKRLRSQKRSRNQWGWGAAARAPGGDIFVKLGTRVVWEWLGDRCGECHGMIVSGLPDESHPLGERAYCCAHCHGTGRRRYPDAERACALGLSLVTYREHWAPRLLAALALLDSFDGSVETTVRAQLSPVA